MPGFPSTASSKREAKGNFLKGPAGVRCWTDAEFRKAKDLLGG